MTISIGRIVIVEYPGVFAGSKPGIVTDVRAYDCIDVTVFGAGEVRGSGVREYHIVKFYETIEEAHDARDPQGAFAYYPSRVASTPNVLVDPDKPIAVSGDVVARILDIAAENRGE